MERQLSLANGSPDVEEIPDIRTLSLAQLETLLAQQEAGSQEALRDAFASRDEAERLREAATRCDADAQASRARYEQAEYVIHELRKAIVEQNKNLLNGLVEQGRIRAYGKRQHSPSPESNVSRKRVAPSLDRASEPVIKVEEPTASASRRSHDDERSLRHGSPGGGPLDEEALDDEPLNDEPLNGEHLDDDDDDEEELLDDEYEPVDDESLGQESPHGQPDTSNNERSTNEPGNDEQVRKATFTPLKRAKAMTLVPRASPREIFAHSDAYHPKRMVRLGNPENEILIYISGQCHGKNRSEGNPGSAGCTVIFGSETREVAKPMGFILEQCGPRGVVYADRNEKTAELRAFVAALEFKIWNTEGWEKVVIATTSNYVYSGITEHVASWDSYGLLRGTPHQGKQMPNFDLWERALALVNEQAYHGCEVQVWKITGAEAIDVKSAALTLARMAHPSPEFYESLGDVDITWTGGQDRINVNNDQPPRVIHETFHVDAAWAAERGRHQRRAERRARKRAREDANPTAPTARQERAEKRAEKRARKR